MLYHCTLKLPNQGIVDFFSCLLRVECIVLITSPTFHYPASTCKYLGTGDSAFTRSLFSSMAASNPVIPSFSAAFLTITTLVTFSIAGAYYLVENGKPRSFSASLQSTASHTVAGIGSMWPYPQSF